MDFNRIKNIEDKTSRVNELYNYLDEDIRFHTKASSIEFLTTIHFINKYLKHNENIIDVGAGTGAYSLFFTSKGYNVSAIELADRNIEVFKSKIEAGMNIDLIQGNALDLSYFKGKKFDHAFLMGPMYHLENKQDKLKSINEIKKILSNKGYIYISFINNDMVLLSEQSYDSSFILSSKYDKTSFKLENFPFVFHTFEEMKSIITEAGLLIELVIAQDGLAEILENIINKYNDEEFKAYLDMHIHLSTKKEMIGCSNHILFICRLA